MKEIILTDEIRHKKYKKIKRLKDKEYIIKKEINSELEEAFINAFNEKDLEKRYSYIYDYMCTYLDNNVCNLCDFKDNKCVANRMKTSVHDINGCCYFRNEGFCKLFKDKKCTNPNISCKLFMCSLVEKKIGFESLPKNYLLLDYFFNRKQKYILQRSYRKKKEYTIKLLLENK